jgi:anti-sigma factor RsiW
MSDMSSSEAPWLRLCHYALCERNPLKLVDRITEARSAVADRLAAFPNIPNAERAALQEALSTLVALRAIAECELELRREVKAQPNSFNSSASWPMQSFLRE